MSKEEIRLALFGESGSGKSTFISSFYGNLESHAYLEKYGYKILCADKKKKAELESKFYNMRDHFQFPKGTDRVSCYEFDFATLKNANTNFKIRWNDYPGGWWSQSYQGISDDAIRQEALKDLLFSHVGVMLLDGAKLTKDGPDYIKKTFNTFYSGFKSITSELSKKKISENGGLPAIWIISVSKSDLLDPEISAKSIRETIVKYALDDLNQLQDLVGDHFGENIILCSAAKAEGQKIISVYEWEGLQLFAPVALIATLSNLAGNKNFIDIFLPTLKSILSVASNIIDADKILKKRADSLAILIRIFNDLGGMDLLKNKIDEKITENTDQRGGLLDVVEIFRAHLTDTSLSRLHYRG